MFTRV